MVSTVCSAFNRRGRCASLACGVAGPGALATAEDNGPGPGSSTNRKKRQSVMRAGAAVVQGQSQYTTDED